MINIYNYISYYYDYINVIKFFITYLFKKENHNIWKKLYKKIFYKSIILLLI